MGEEGGTMRQNGGRDHVIRGHKMAAATTCSVSRVSLSVKAHLSACESEQHTCYSMICYVHTAGLNAQFRYTTQIRFFVWLFTLLLKCGPSTDCCVNSSRSWNDPHAQLIIADITPIDHATMGFTEVTMATATSTAGLYGLMLKIRALKSHKTCISTSSHAHTPHMIFLTVKKKYNINISGAAIAMEMAGNKHVSHASEQSNTNNNTNNNISNERPVQLLSPRLSRGDTSFRRSISLRKQVGVGPYWVATGTGYRTLANLFGIAKSSIRAIVHDFCKAVHQVLMPDYIKLPQGDDLQEVLRDLCCSHCQKHGSHMSEKNQIQVTCNCSVTVGKVLPSQHFYLLSQVHVKPVSSMMLNELKTFCLCISAIRWEIC